MMGSRFSPVDARLFTWEWTSSFDVAPSMTELQAAFEKEFPKTVARLAEVGGLFRLLHLVSFNSTEGRRSRYLVVVVETPMPNSRKRLLPRQVAAFAAADRSLRKQDAAGKAPGNGSNGVGKAPGNNSGNFLCYGLDGKCFHVLVFFEGRLCHWSELVAADFSPGRVEQELQRFRRFLKSDPLFSRGDSFEEVLIENLLQCDLKRAARDPLWKRFDLRREPLEPKRRRGSGLAAVFLISAVVCCKILLPNVLGAVSEPAIRDALPVELELPAAWQESTENAPPAEVEPQKPVAETIRCVLPSFKLKGVIAAKLMMAEVDGVSSTVLLGDSLGNFKLRSVRRDGVELVCDDSLVHRGVVHAEQ